MNYPINKYIKEMNDAKIYKSQIYLKIIFIKYNSNIIYCTFIFVWRNDIGKIKELINGIYNNINNNYNYNFNPNRISLLTFTKGSVLSNYIINKKSFKKLMNDYCSK